MNGYSELIKFHRQETSDRVAMGKDIKLKSDLVYLGYPYALTGKLIGETEDRVWVRFYHGVYSLLKSDITISSRED